MAANTLAGANAFGSRANYTDDEVEFLKAMERFKREHCRPFPTCSEVLAVLQSLGYRKIAEPGPIARYRDGDH